LENCFEKVTFVFVLQCVHKSECCSGCCVEEKCKSCKYRIFSCSYWMLWELITYYLKVEKKPSISTTWLPKLSTRLCLPVADNCNAAHSPCAVHDCPPGKVCYLQQVQCIAAPCHPVPACKDQDYDYNWFTTPVQLISWPTDFRIPSSFLGDHDFETQLEGWPSCWTVLVIFSQNCTGKCRNSVEKRTVIDKRYKFQSNATIYYINYSYGNMFRLYWVIIRPSKGQIQCITIYSAFWDSKRFQYVVQFIQ